MKIEATNNKAQDSVIDDFLPYVQKAKKSLAAT